MKAAESRRAGQGAPGRRFNDCSGRRESPSHRRSCPPQRPSFPRGRESPPLSCPPHRPSFPPHRPSFPRRRESPPLSCPPPTPVIPAPTSRHSRGGGNPTAFMPAPPAVIPAEAGIPTAFMPAPNGRHSRESGNPPRLRAPVPTGVRRKGARLRTRGRRVDPRLQEAVFAPGMVLGDDVGDSGVSVPGGEARAPARWSRPMKGCDPARRNDASDLEA